MPTFARRASFTTLATALALFGLASLPHAADPVYRLVENWGPLPSGQAWGEVTGVAVDAKNTIVAVRRSDPPIIE